MDAEMRDQIARAVTCLAGGGVVLLPTDTVYGLAVHPEHDEAVTRLFAMKGRPRSRNLPVMISEAAQVTALGGILSGSARRLLESKYVPGPLTVAVATDPGRLVPWLSGRPEFAVRMPDDERLLAIIGRTGPLLVTSANKHAQATRESAPEILATLEAAPDLVIDDGKRDTVPSTLVNCGVDPAVIERHGAVPDEEIEAILR